MYSSSSLPIQPFQIDLIERICTQRKFPSSAGADETTGIVMDEKTDSANQDELLNVLAFVFSEQRKILENALELAEDGNISEYETMHSSRICWSVPSTNGKPYICFHDFCPCRSFQDLSRQTIDRVMVADIILYCSMDSLVICINTPL